MDVHDSGYNASFGKHLQLPGMPRKFASQTGAYLQVKNHVHSEMLTDQSPVFADLFMAASDIGNTTYKRNGRTCIPMINHNFADVCAAVEFLYQWTTSDWENNPSRARWTDVDKARPIIQFAHKFNMKSILKACDLLPSK